MPRPRPKSELPVWWRWALDHEGLTTAILILAMPVCGVLFPAVFYGAAMLVGGDASADEEQLAGIAMVLLVAGMVFPIMVAAVLGFGLMKRGWVIGVGFGVGYVLAVLGQWGGVIFTACVSMTVFAVLRGLDQRLARPETGGEQLTGVGGEHGAVTARPDEPPRSPYARRGRHD
jgi:hypothetical protein